MTYSGDDELIEADSVISALGKALRKEFGDGFSVYDEEVKQGVVTPCFFICCAENRERRFLGSRYFCERKYLIKYYPKSSDRKKAECDEVLGRLFDCLLWLDDNGQPLMGRKMSGKYEKGVLGFFVNYDMFLYRREDKTLMGELLQHTAAKNRTSTDASSGKSTDASSGKSTDASSGKSTDTSTGKGTEGR